MIKNRRKRKGKEKTWLTSLPPTLLPVAHGIVTFNYTSLKSIYSLCLSVELWVTEPTCRKAAASLSESVQCSYLAYSSIIRIILMFYLSSVSKYEENGTVKRITDLTWFNKQARVAVSQRNRHVSQWQRVYRTSSPCRI